MSAGGRGPSPSTDACFRFGPRDRRGVLAGLGAAQLAVLGCGLLGALAALRALAGAAGVAVAAVAAASGAAVALVPVAGRPLAPWLPDAARHAAARLASSAGAGPRRQAPGGRRPRPFRDLALVALTAPDGSELGAVADRGSGRTTAVLPLQAEAFGLLDAAERARRVAAWSGLLAALAGRAGLLDRLAWIERTVPDDAAWARHPPGLARPELTSSYEDLLAGETRGLLRHELLLACSVRGPAAALHGELARLRSHCLDAGVAAGGPLGPDALATVMRAATADGVGTSARWPWPASASETWRELRTDALVHVTYWVAEWPRTTVGDDFLLPLLLGSWVRRSVALVLAPRPPGRAGRAAERARTSKLADAELRRRHGFAVTARLRDEQAAVEQREQELAAGHAAYRFSGYVTVSATGPAAIADACATVERAAALARLELRRLFGCQGEAFACTLPAGRGCG